MFRHPLTLALWASLIASVPALAQETLKDRATQAEVRFGDGSLVRMSLLQESVEIQTKYGKLTIPIQDIRRIEFGLHIPGEVDQQIGQSIRHLASDLYKEREGATRELLQAGHWACPSLVKASRSGDQEVATRAATVLRQLSERLPPDLLKLKEDDVIHTAEFTVVGRIASPTFKACSPHFGEIALKLCDLRAMHLRHHANDIELAVDAVKYAEGETWFDTGITLDPSLRIVLTGEGQIDLWPQGPGQYVASPKGFNTTGKGGVFLAGALVARIGERGKTFVVGERYEGTSGEEGRLYLQIVASPWNNGSTGIYRVRVRTDNVALSQR